MILLTIRIIFSFMFDIDSFVLRILLYFFQHHFLKFYILSYYLHLIAQIHLCNLVNVCSLMYSPYTSFFSCFTLYVFHTLSMYYNFDLVSCIFVYNSGWCKFERDGRNLLYLIYMLICYLFYSLT